MVVWVCVSRSVQSDFCNPMDCRLPVFSVHGIIQTRILGWVPFPSPGELPNLGIGLNLGLLHCRQIFLSSEPPGKLYLDIRLVAQSCPTICDPMDCSPPGSSVHGDSPGKNTRVGSHSLLQGIFSTQGSNPGLPHCRWILYCLSHQGSPRILEQVAYPFSRGSSHPRNPTGVSCIAGRFVTNWATREAAYLDINRHICKVSVRWVENCFEWLYYLFKSKLWKPVTLNSLKCLIKIHLHL